MPAVLQRTHSAMSTDAENNKLDDMKVEEEKEVKEPAKKVDNDVSKDTDEDDKKDDTEEETPEAEVEKPAAKKPAAKAKETKKKKAKSEEEESEKEESDKDDEADADEKDKSVPLLDQPLKQSGSRQRKGVERFSTEPKEGAPVEIPRGKGVALGSIAVIEYNIHKVKSDELKKVHHLLFGRSAKANFIKKNIRKFNGFEFDADSDDHEDKKAELAKLSVKSVAELLALPVGGSKDELVERVMAFLLDPAAGSHGNKPASAASGKAGAKATAGLTRGGRPRRSAAARATSKGYSESEDEGDVQRAPRSRRAKGKRVNLKDESSSNEEEVGSEPKESEDSVEETPPSSDDSDDAPSSRKKRGAVTKPPPKKAVPAKKGASPAKKAVPAKKGASPAKKAVPEKKSPVKRAVATAEDDDDDSSNDDAPLVKKAKAPPTEAEIKSFVKEILQGANLEEITMKTVCKQVYARFPDFDLAHKKDFIKATVKSLIST